MPKPGIVLQQYENGNYNYARRQFETLFGEGNPEYTVNKKSVEDAVSRLLVDGVPYGERYGIEVNSSNLEATVSHIIHNLTQGEVASSFYSDSPLWTVIAGKDQGGEVTPVIPPVPHTYDKPSDPGSWVRFWGKLGLYRSECSDYEERMGNYHKEQEYLNAHRSNECRIKQYASELEQKIRENNASKQYRRPVSANDLIKQESVALGREKKQRTVQRTGIEQTKSASSGKPQRY